MSSKPLFEQIPKQLQDVIVKVKDRVAELVKTYKSLANYGRPFFEDIKEIAVVYYVHKKFNASLNLLAEYLGVDKTTLYKVVHKIENEQRASYTDPQTRKVITIQVTPDQLIGLVEKELLNVSAREHIVDPMESSLVQEFMTKDIERQANRKRRAFYNLSEKKETLRAIRELMLVARENNIPSNPDMWDKDTILKLLDLKFGEDTKRKRVYVMYLRRVPKWRSWLDGYVGAVTSYITPKMTVLFYEDYLKLKKAWKDGLLSDSEILVIWLHISTGAREGWGSEATPHEDIDLDQATTSLIGLKWENLTRVGDTYILNIYEHKTQKTWSCDLSWLDGELIPVLLKYRKRERGSIIKDITGCKTVEEFRKWYRKVLEKVSYEILQLPYRLTPHDMRRSHISILAELGVPLEHAVSSMMSLGVGWDDLKTAVVFYMRFSKFTKEKLFETISTRKKEIEARL